MRSYRSAWHTFTPSLESTITMHMKADGWTEFMRCTGSTFATVLPGDDTAFEFYTMPSPARGVPEKRWTLKGPLPKFSQVWTFDVEQDLLVLPRQ